MPRKLTDKQEIERQLKDAKTLTSYPRDKQEKSKGGRPTEYSEDITNLFCSRIAMGDSLRKVVKLKDMPSHQTIYNWFSLYPEFVEQYARAKQDSADSRADQIEEIAEKVLAGEYEPQAARVAIDAFKWTSGKHKPKKYGDKIQQDINIPEGVVFNMQFSGDDDND